MRIAAANRWFCARGAEEYVLGFCNSIVLLNKGSADGILNPHLHKALFVTGKCKTTVQT